MKYYLVTIDTTNRPNAKGFRPGIQNFYFCIAPGEVEAKNLILSTFRANPGLLNQLIPCTNACELDLITRLLTPNQTLWSYIPIGNVRAPGQQKLIPSPDSLVNQNPTIHAQGSYTPSAKPIPKPQTYEEQAKHDMKDVSQSTPKNTGDMVDQLLNDPRFKEALLTKLGMNAPGVAQPPTLDPESSMRFSDDGSYDDNLTAPPQQNTAPAPVHQGLPQRQGLPINVNGPIPGLLQPDEEAMRRLRENLNSRQSGLEIID